MQRVGEAPHPFFRTNVHCLLAIVSAVQIKQLALQWLTDQTTNEAWVHKIALYSQNS